ncbi:TolC family outer membrane protein [Sphingomonas sp. RHCKR7]|uniref:TolC family outer membrane protein n=1 Tax=Sphingomonas folli TaxID=2862497 RepID=UPI001CA5E2E3|nr:TolC family outer membrane protein [Sphingomonas folli]MBW6527887.1 TolC family outer membrane protein [Sphingomonas folli]
MNRRLLLAAASLAVAGAPTRAETLAEAVRAAAATSPLLAAARARQDARAELPEQARALGRLTAVVEANGGYDRFYGGGNTAGGVSADLPIWTSGRVRSAVRAANADGAAGAQALRDVEASVLVDVVAAFADLLLQQQALTIASAQITLLDRQVAEAEARFRLGTGTQTDVMQLRAQREGATATELSARAALAAAEAQYRALVGRAPGRLEQPSAALPGLPSSALAARERAVQANPGVLAAASDEQAARARVDQARSEGAPSLGLGGSYGYGFAFGSRDGALRAASAGVTFRLPLLTGGVVASRVRAAAAGARAAGYDRDAAEREAVRNADTAWSNAAAARARVDAGERAVAAATRALEGVRAEYSLGLRSTLDILIADQSLRGAQLSLAGARSDLVVNQAVLLRSVGALNAGIFG